MAKYLLVSFKTCPWVQRAAIVLREKNVEFEFRHIDRDNRPDWFLAISPHKKVPVISIDNKVSLFESNAIAEYLDETIAAAAASRRSGAARNQPRLDRLSADLLRNGEQYGYCTCARLSCVLLARALASSVGGRYGRSRFGSPEVRSSSYRVVPPASRPA